MISYRDMSFCSAFGEKCSNDQCARAMTEAERFKANRWAENSGLGSTPVSYGDFSEGCLIFIPATGAA